MNGKKNQVKRRKEEELVVGPPSLIPYESHKRRRLGKIRRKHNTQKNGVFLGGFVTLVRFPLYFFYFSTSYTHKLVNTVKKSELLAALANKASHNTVHVRIYTLTK
jgi:hypothetical protein